MTIRLAIILLAVTPCAAFSQSFTIEPNPVSAIVDLDIESPFEIMAEATIINNTSETLNLKWVRIINDKPECWRTYVFDPWLAHIPWVDSAEFDLNANISSNLNVFAFINQDGIDYAGQAQVVLEVRNINNPEETVLVEYNITALGDNNCVTSVSENDRHYLQLYPNPTGSSFQLKHAQDVHSLTIYSSLGEEIKNFDSGLDQMYDVNDLEKGVYTVRLHDRDGELIKAVKLIKD